MKKSLLALAVLGAFAGAASAQSSVTLFGLIDASVNSIKNGANTVKRMDSNQLNSSRLGFRGTEDLGGGMLAGFWLEGALANDTGTPGGLTFTRRSTVSLSGNFGEVRMGRDYTVNFSTLADNDAYGANGFASAVNLHSLGLAQLGTSAATTVRANNMVGYFLPANLGGVYGAVQVAAGEGDTNNNKFAGGRVGYAAGPVDVSFATSQTTVNISGPKFKDNSIGASYNFGVAKLYGMWDQKKYGANKYTTVGVSASVPLGQGEFRVSYAKGNSQGAGIDANDAKLFGAEYLYNLSKRTAVYTQYGQLKNEGTSNLSVVLGENTPNGTKSTGYGVGVRHIF